MTDNPKNNQNSPVSNTSHKDDIVKILRSMGILMGHSSLVFKHKNKTINELKNLDELRNKTMLLDASNKLTDYILNNIKIEDLFSILLSNININTNTLTYLSYKKI
jgi:hypothetical protein